MDLHKLFGTTVTFHWPPDPRHGQAATVTNILCGMDGPRVFWLTFADGSTFRANLGHIA